MSSLRTQSNVDIRSLIPCLSEQKYFRRNWLSIGVSKVETVLARFGCFNYVLSSSLYLYFFRKFASMK